MERTTKLTNNMNNLDEINNEKDISLKEAELVEELKKAVKDELPGLEIIDQNKDDNFLDFDELEEELRKEIDAQLSELVILEENKKKIGNPQSLGETIKNVVWEQFINQIGGTAGEDFIKKNKGLTLDLSKDAHIQTTDNFENGKIATHNTEINYQKRYDDWQSNFVRDKDGNIVMRYDRIDNENKAVLKKEARKPFDEGRPKGSSSASVDMDHTVSAGEIIRDSEANTHLSREEQLDFANSNANLNPIDSGANKSKGDHKMENWLDSERDGQKPAERFNIDEDQLRHKDKEAREEYAKQKEKGEKKSVEAGKKSQRAEAFRMGGEALRAFVMVLLAELVRKIIQQLVIWLKSAEKNISTFLQSVKTAIVEFVVNLKNEVLSAADAAVTAIATAIFGPIVRLVQKAWILLKQGAQTIKEAIEYIKRPENKTKDFEMIMMEVGKIVIVGLSAAGALVLSEVIEKALMEIAFFAIEIPLLGSFGSIIGIFLGALISGIVGALALKIIDNAMIKHQLAQIKKQEDVLFTQVTQTHAKLALATSLNAGYHVAQTEEFFIQSAVDMSGKRNQAIHNQDETRFTINETSDSADKTSVNIQILKGKNIEEDDDL